MLKVKFKIILILSQFIIFLLISCSSNQKSSKQEIEEKIKTGMNNLVINNNTKALEIFQDVIKNDPRNKEAYYYLGLCYIRLNKIDDAAAAFGALYELDPLYNIGEDLSIKYIRYLYVNKKDYENAEKEINKYIRFFPKSSANAQLLSLVADSYRNQSNFDEAIKIYKRIINTFPENNSFRKSAVDMVKFIEANSDYNYKPLKIFAQAKNKHMPDESLDLFREVLARYPNARIAPLVKFEIALCFDHGRMNLFESALVYYQKLIDEHPNTEYAKIGEKNKKRIEEIFSKKDSLLTGEHKKMYEQGLKKSKNSNQK